MTRTTDENALSFPRNSKPIAELRRRACERAIPFGAFAPEIRKIICAPNAIESAHYVCGVEGSITHRIDSFRSRERMFHGALTSQRSKLPRGRCARSRGSRPHGAAWRLARVCRRRNDVATDAELQGAPRSSHAQLAQRQPDRHPAIAGAPRLLRGRNSFSPGPEPSSVARAYRSPLGGSAAGSDMRCAASAPHARTFSPAQHMHAPVAVPNARPGDFTHALTQCRLADP